MAGNRGFGDALADGYDKSAAKAPAASRAPLPTDSVLASRSTTLADLATGKLVNERTLWVDPTRCKPWEYHNRDQAMLDETSCADLIDSFKAEGRQRLPAIVRRLKDDPAFDYEIIAGVRRHWTVSWLRAHNYPNFEFLVTVQPMTDEEAFRLADVENRARQDLTDIERARDYTKALHLFYGGKQIEMAARLNVQPAWLSRLLELARLPEEVVASFAHPRELKVEHGKILAPLLKLPAVEKRVRQAAVDLATAQLAARNAGQQPIRAADVVRQLQHAAVAKAPKPKVTAPEWVSGQNKPMMRAQKVRGGGVHLEILSKSGATREELKAAFGVLLDGYQGDLPFG